MIITRSARPTLSAVEMDCGDVLHFILADGTARDIYLLETSAEVFETTVEKLQVEKPGAVTNYRFRCRLKVDDPQTEESQEVVIEREVATQRSFYEPTEVLGVRLWFDACDDIFDFLTETHGDCRPRKQARFALQDVRLRICPQNLLPWCPLPQDGLRVEDCYNGEDVWLGAYFGASAHGGLDINHPRGTPIWAPLDIDDHWLFNSVQAGDNNNRWRGLHRWPDGSTWVIQVHHLIHLLMDEHTPIAAGTHYAEGAGVWVGSHDHSHFVFKIREPGADESDDILLDPWILFWQMYRDGAADAKLATQQTAGQ